MIKRLLPISRRPIRVGAHTSDSGRVPVAANTVFQSIFASIRHARLRVVATASSVGAGTLAATFLAGSLVLAGCAAPSTAGHTYKASETRRPMQIETGVIQAIRTVRLEQDQSSGVGTGAGAVVGGIAGSNVGQGRGAAIGTVLGAVVGGVAGSHAEHALSTRSALEITVQTDSGRTFAVVQEAGGESFAPGQRIRIVTDPARGTTRISQ